MSRLASLAPLFAFFAFSSACGESHVSDPDGGAGDDAGLPDATFDVPLDVPLDVPAVTHCRGELSAMDGDPCFCQGAFLLDGTVGYRTSYDLEVYDLSGGDVVRVANVPQSRPGSEGAIALANDHLYVGNWGIETFDVSEPMAPRPVDAIDFEGTATDLIVIGSTLWAGIDDGEVGALRGWDLTTPSAPRDLVTLTLMGNPGSVLAYGDRIVVIEARRFGEDGPDTAAIIDVSSPARPRVETRLELAGRATLRRHASIEGRWLHVAGSPPLLQTFDLEARERVATLEAPEGSTGGLGITVSGGLAFVSGWQIQVADVSDPLNPRWIGRLEAPNDVHHVERRDDTLFIGTGGYLGRIPLDCR